MRTAFEEEDEIAERRPSRDEDSRDGHGEDRELTISSTTLLAVFFGLVLLCGLFFGLGYTLGRRASSDSSQLATATPAATDPLPSSSAAKPSAASQPAALPVPADLETSQPASDTTAPADASADSSQAKAPETAPTPAPQAVKAALPQASPAPVSATPVSTPAAAAAPASIMVQIAAISNPADADVLVGALQKHGYTVATHRFPGDPLIHVQVGPFTNRADAIAMRQKLLSDGYNAILK